MESEEEQQIKVNSIVRLEKRVRNEDKCRKTKLMRTGKNEGFADTDLEGETVEQRVLYKYLGSTVVWNKRCTKVIKSRLSNMIYIIRQK